MPPARVRSISAPAAALRSIEELHARRMRAPAPDDPPDDAARRDHRHVGLHAVGRCRDRWSSSACPGSGCRRSPPPRWSAGRRCVCSSSSSCSRSVRAASARCSCSRTSSSATCFLQRLVLRPHAAQRRRSCPRSPARRARRRRWPRCTRANTPNVTACSTGTPDFDCTCAEISISWLMTRRTGERRCGGECLASFAASSYQLPASLHATEPASAPENAGQLPKAGSWKRVAGS